EHRLFSHISMNWRGKPLIDHETIVSLIGATTTTQGLRVRAELDRASYPKGSKISDAEIADLPLDRDELHPQWNYTLRPQACAISLFLYRPIGLQGHAVLEQDVELLDDEVPVLAPVRPLLRDAVDDQPQQLHHRFVLRERTAR